MDAVTLQSKIFLYSRNFSLASVHIDAAQRIARLARENGVSKFIHVSALNASVDSPSEYLRTKALGEQAVLSEFPDAVIVRPSRVFGHEDWLFRQMGFFTKFIPGSFIPLINGGLSKMRPVYVGDVAAALGMLAKNTPTNGNLIELYG